MDIYEVKIHCDSTTLLYAIIHHVILKNSISETALWCADWLYDIQQPIALSHLCNLNALLQMEILVNHCTWSLFQLMLYQNREIETEYACAYVCVYVYVFVYVWKRESKRRERQRENWYLHYYLSLSSA